MLYDVVNNLENKERVLESSPSKRNHSNIQQLSKHRFSIELIENTIANIFISFLSTHTQSRGSHRGIWFT